MGRQVFISYSTKNSAEACAFRRRLEENGINCWMAPESIDAGSDYAESIPIAVKNCGAFILLLSKNSQQSKWVRKEIDLAFYNEVPILPVYIENCKLSEKYNFLLNDIQTVEIYSQNRDKFNTILLRLKALLNGVESYCKRSPTSRFADYLTIDTCDRKEFKIDGSTLIKYNGKKAFVVVPYGVSDIGDGAFAYNEDVVNVVLPDTVRVIDEASFDECHSLCSIEISDRLVEIRGGAFKGCTKLDAITLPDSLTNISGSLINGGAFSRSGLKSVHIPANVEFIGTFTFSSCVDIKSITVDSNNAKYKSVDNCLIDIEKQCVLCCCSTGKIPIKEVITIGTGAFYGSEIKEIVIPDNITKIGPSAFGACSSLKRVVVSDSVAELCDYAFSGCDCLTEVVLPNTLMRIGDGAFSRCKSLLNIKLPKNLNHIASYLFSECIMLQEIVIPNGVTSIGQYAFENCEQLYSVSIPNNVRTIYDNAFSKCKNLTKVNYDGTKKEWKKIYRENFKKKLSALYSNGFTVYCTDGETVSFI